MVMWKKGVFDVDDIFNNSLGAVIGGVIAVILNLRKTVGNGG